MSPPRHEGKRVCAEMHQGLKFSLRSPRFPLHFALPHHPSSSLRVNPCQQFARMKPKTGLDTAEAVSKLAATDQTATEAPALLENKKASAPIADEHGDTKESKNILKDEKSAIGQAMSHGHASAGISKEIMREKLTAEEVFESRLVGLIEAYRDLMASRTVAEPESKRKTVDPIESLVQKLEKIKECGTVEVHHLDERSTKDHKDEAPTDVRVLAQDVGTKSDKTEKAVDSDIAVMNDRSHDDDETADNMVKTDDVANMAATALSDGLTGAVSDAVVSPAAAASEGKRAVTVHPR
ncbi:hypothetical protein L209DRAFT_577869 [Thermothelomyces heterothallicus CBS 203.75]